MNLKNVTIRYFIMYFLSFLVVFFCSTLIYAVASNSLEASEIKRFDMQIEQGVSDFENTFERMKMIEKMIRQNNNFQELAKDIGKIENENTLRLNDTKNLLAELRVSLDLSYVFVAFQNNNGFASNEQSSNDFENYYGMFLKLESDVLQLDSAQQVKDELFGSVDRGNYFIPLEQVSDYDGVMLEQSLLYLVENRYPGSKGSYLFGIVLDNDIVKETILGPEMGQDVFLKITDTISGECILSYGMQNYAEKEYHTVVNTANRMRWQIETGTSLRSIQDKLKPVNVLLWIYLVFGICLVVVLTFIFSFRGYKGMRQIMSEFPEKGSEKEKRAYENEYSMVAQMIKGQKKQSDAWKTQLDEARMRNDVILLEHMLTAGIGQSECKRLLEKYFCKEPEFFCVVMLRIFGEERNRNEEWLLELVKMLKEKMKVPFVNVHSGEMDELFLIALEPSGESYLGYIEEIFEECINVMADCLDGNVHVGVSAIGTGSNNICRCYEQAKQVVQSAIVRENENIVRIFCDSNILLAENFVNMDFLNRLNNYLLGGRKKEAKEQVAKMEAFFSKRPLLFEVQKEQVYYSIRSVLSDVSLYFDKVDNMNEILPAYEKSFTLDDMVCFIQETIDKICCTISIKKKNSNEELKRKVIDFLELHYAEASLSAYQVSRAMNISERYLSQIVKDGTGESFAGYLLKIRLQQACRLLEQTDYSNEKIAEITGFGAANTFYRNFNKIIGMSPKLYKETVGNKQRQDESKSVK